MSNLMHQEEDLLESLIPAIAEVKSDAMEWSLNNLRRYDPAFKVPYSIFEVLADEARDLGNRHGFERIPINADDLVLLEQLEAIDDYGFMAPLPRMIVGDIVRHDWSRTGNDVYTVSIGGCAYRGNALYLQSRLFGVRISLWEFWANRVNQRIT